MTSFVFDVDGTLTDARQTIDLQFEEFMQEFTGMHTCYICTGSDRPKTIEQIGEQLTNKFTQAYHCSGNHVYQNGKEIGRTDWQLSEDEYNFLEAALDNINYPEKTGNHIEQRIGTANFSICGRNVNLAQREKYALWEREHKARHTVAQQFNKLFPQSQALVAGETSIDIFKLGHDKSQVRQHIDDDIIFFGDKCFKGGNDYALSTLSERFHQINNGWRETYLLLQNFYHNH
jgi:phosphomannomutase